MVRSAGLFLTLHLLFAGAAWPELPPPPDTPEGILSFADTLLARGESFRAATEYTRFLHHFPTHPSVPDALKGLGKAYAQAGRWADASALFRRLLEIGPDAIEARRLLGSALYGGGNYREAARLLLRPDADEDGSALGTMALLRADDVDDLPPPARQDLAEEFSALPRKHPAWAGTLSALLPGAGHVYTDRPRDAAVSFVLNAAFIWGTYEAVRREEWALAGILGLFEVGWYTGNIVSSVNAAHKWNRREEGRFFRKWEAAVLPRWGVVLGSDSAGFRLSWSW